MSDTLQRFLFEDEPIRGEIVHLDATWRAVLERHEYPPELSNVLGELMASAALLAATLKFDGAVILQIQGSGPVQLMIAECTAEHTLRATARWEGDLSGQSFPGMIGQGRFVISLVPPDGRQPYQGIVDLAGLSIAACLEHYMQHSEQLETRLWLAAAKDRAAGMLIQRLPGREERDADSWNRAVKLAETVKPGELLKLPAKELLHRLYHEETLRLFDPRVVSFRCSCSAERVAGMLRMMGQDEVRSILDERGSVEVKCEYCNRKYDYDRVDAEQLFASSHAAPAARTRH